MDGFPRVEYIDWIRGRVEAADHDLATSDLRGADDEDGVVPDRLAGLPDPDDGRDLEERIAEVYGVAPGSVLVTAGATFANALTAATALTEAEGDRSQVLVEDPGYEPLVETPRALGAGIDRFRRPPGEGYRLDPDRVTAATDGKTAVVTVTNRHNPSGRLVGRETLSGAADAASAAGARLLVDEVYAPLVPRSRTGDRGSTSGEDAGGESPHRAFGGITAAGLENVVVTGSLTKFHGLGGLRVGWLVADPRFVECARGVDTHFPSVPEPSRLLAERALHNRERLAERSRDRVERNATVLEEFLARRGDLSGPAFEGSTYAFLRHDEGGDTVASAAWERGLVVVPGRFFGVPDRFRVSLGRDTDHVRAALDVLGQTLDDL